MHFDENGEQRPSDFRESHGIHDDAERTALYHYRQNKVLAEKLQNKDDIS